MFVREDGARFFVADCHAHLGTNSLMKRFGAADFPQPGIRDPKSLAERGFLGEDAVYLMDSVGIDMACAFPVANPHTDYSHDNGRIMQWAKDYPDRIVPFMRVNPNFGPEASVETVQKYAAMGAKGIKFHPKWDGGYETNDPEIVYPAVEEAGKHGLTCLFHTGEVWNASPALLGYMARDFPHVNFICGHMGTADGFHEAIGAAKQLENYFLDTTELWPPTVIAKAVRYAGADRVLFGSDMPYIPAAAELDKITRHSGLNDDDLRLVLGENLARLVDFPIPDIT